MRRRLLLVVGSLAPVVLAGCYASHARTGGEGCGIPPEVGWTCDALPNPILPDAVCVLDDGTLLAVRDSMRPVHCERSLDASAQVFAEIHCMPEGPVRRGVARCETDGTTFVGPRARPPFVEHTFEIGPSGCGALDREVPGVPLTPTRSLAELCDDPYAWCGAPVVFQVHLDDYDPCGGASFVDRCAITVDGDRLIVAIETGPSAPHGCRTIVGPRIATCVAPPLAAGLHDVLDDGGRLLGTLEVAAEPPIGELERTCTPIPAS